MTMAPSKILVLKPPGPAALNKHRDSSTRLSLKGTLAEDLEQLLPDTDEDPELHCIICVGSTGAGKSATISKCTRRPVSSGSGRDRVTVRCAKYDLRHDAEEDLQRLGFDPSMTNLVWVDTVGWDDADLRGM